MHYGGSVTQIISMYRVAYAKPSLSELAWSIVVRLGYPSNNVQDIRSFSFFNDACGK